MKIRIAFVCLFIIPFISPAQGIQFEKGLSWDQLFAKARAENKYVLVDCFATWCGPCKLMDAQVYPQKDVGDYFNARFISIKMQVDKTKNDDSLVRAWYETSAGMQQHYSVNVLPTFLVFSSDGEALHKVSGYQSPEDFIQMGKDAQDPSKQYYTVVKNFQPGKRDTAEEKELVRLFQYSDPGLAGKIGRDYLSRIPAAQLSDPHNGELMVELQQDTGVLAIAVNFIKGHFTAKNLRFIAAFGEQPEVHELAADYISKLNASEMGKKENLAFMTAFNKDPRVKAVAKNYIASLTYAQLYSPDMIHFLLAFTDSTKDRGFTTLYHNPAKVDRVLKQKGAAKGVICGYIEKEETVPALKAAKRSGIEPDWAAISQSITARFGSIYLPRIMLTAKLTWYRFTKDWKNYSRYILARTEIDSLTQIPKMEFEKMAGEANGAAWEIFLHSNNPRELTEALRWCDRLVKVIPSGGYAAFYADTRANLLYKLGKKEQALKQETHALALSPNNEDMKKNLEKMKAGLPTWTGLE